MDRDGILTSLQPLLEILATTASMGLLIMLISKAYERHKASNAFFDFLLAGKTPSQSDRDGHKTKSNTGSHPLSVLISFVGLQVSFLTWGWIQERIMKTEYGEDHVKVPSSNLLVLSNRVFSILFAMMVLFTAQKPSPGRPPFIAFAFPAMANTVSSFAGYDSLKFMSFPMSTVCKTLKIIPTMLIGTLIQKKKYHTQEYLSAIVITLGAAMFAMEFSFYPGGLEQFLRDSDINYNLAIPGAVLMGCYLLVDAFTSNLQKFLMNEYMITPYECMLGINVFSIFLNIFNLIQAGHLGESYSFLINHPQALLDFTLLAGSSACGQLFIYYTIERNGPLVLTIIQLTRQLLSILLSSWSFGHVVNFKAWIGIFLVFSGMLAMNLSKPKPSSSSSNKLVGDVNVADKKKN